MQTKVNYGEFVDLYNALVDRIKLRACMNGAAFRQPVGAARCAADALRSMSAGGGASAFGADSSEGAGGSSASSAEGGSSSSGSGAASSILPKGAHARRNGSGSAYLVSGAALKAVNGVYTQSGESDGVPKYCYNGAGGSQYSLLRRTVSGGRYWYICESAGSPSSANPPRCLRSRC